MYRNVIGISEMDDAKQETYKIPAEWVDRIFLRLEYTFQEKWTSRFTKRDILEIEKMRWASALYKISANEVKRGIEACANLRYPPTPIEFYDYAKGYKPIPRPKPEMKPVNREAGQKAIAEIKRNLHGNYHRD